MLASMSLLLDSFWRAMAYCLHKRVIVWSLLPLLAMALMAWLLGYFFWADAVLKVQSLLDGVGWLHSLWLWLQGLGLGYASEVVASIFVVLGAMPVLVVLVLLLVGLFMAPVLTQLVAEKRFVGLEKKHGGSTMASLVWSGGSTLIALLALFVTLPLWVFPPLMLVVAPLIWGWLTYRVMAFDALSEHASKDERRALFARHRMSLILMGVICGYLGAAPGVVWISGLLFLAAFWILVPIAIWIYALVFAFSALWFAHFCLAALEQMRAQTMPSAADPQVPFAPGADDSDGAASVAR
ncbi:MULTISPECIES: EI24 domain-containing protein [Comamonas]|uniref:Membrane protein n=1 Tax=Comamonas thiooxydans TaxID=363952 RepID=A0A096F8U7_9BURK|nr:MULTISPECIES: EI24 domain-containing protein [Comamonas]KGG83964.1 membrane protein [Comamonas thiooxydans]KGG88677.1 membrane protein [Comamonas thiooxydans]KGG94175.1 membrane protein [Comamonas thiooxydans]KGG99610.1 membrane protein [Comamonas thiooxydans]KGH04811.1 membrane protein [Comamonas thiooxydans]